MSDPVITVDGLGKRFRLGSIHGSRGLHELVERLFRRTIRGGRRRPGGPDELWALRDVSFEVRRGEILGLMGHNGAGKSVLLKILSRITHPSEGRARIQGRVGSLLEVGAGFHPELTGEENLYLVGAILGMSRREIRRKLDAIIDFAHMETFLDTPVKRYSSGMYVRLAFAVATHLESTILLLDEVLAVGDTAFREKCLGRVRAMADEGRTVLLVSHNSAILRQTCERSLLLDGGRLAFDGPTGEALERYAALAEEQDGVASPPAASSPGEVADT